jgi:hypothetical protein
MNLVYGINVLLNIGMLVYTKDKTFMIIALLWLIAGEIRVLREKSK